LDKLEFEEMVAGLGAFLARQELRTVYDHFDTNKDGNIHYEEFVNTLRVRSFKSHLIYCLDFRLI
jgi:Ca2+-binding EF-hand superfamily protein